MQAQPVPDRQPRAPLGRQRNLVWSIALLLGVATWLLLAQIAGSVDIDDAPITYRYAENLAAGNGFVYNLGERIQGTSTPLYTLVLAGLKLAGAPIPATSNAINLLASVVVVLLVFLTTERVTGKSLLAGLAAAAYLLVQSPFLRYTSAGMETPFYMALIVATFYALALERTRTAALLAGLCAVTRLDGLGVVAALLTTLLIQRRRMPWREGIIALAPLLLWSGFAFAYFGSVLPQSFMAKRSHFVSEHTDQFWFVRQAFGWHASTPSFLFALIVPGAALVFHRGPRRSWALAPLLWLFAYTAAYTIASIPSYEWYLSPIYPVAAVLIGAGLFSVAEALRFELTAATPQRGPRVAAWLGPLTIVLLLLVYVPIAIDGQASYLRYLNEFEGARVRAGLWLRDHTPTDAVVVSGAIGHIGYVGQRYIFDSARLVTQTYSPFPDGPRFGVHEGFPAPSKECGPIAEFAAGSLAAHVRPVAIDACHQKPWARFGDLTLAQIRLAAEVRTADAWSAAKDGVQIESQWLIEAPLPAEAWTLYVHFTDAQGNTLAQADHELDRQVDGVVAPLQIWDPTTRSFTYTPLPDNWAQIAGSVTEMRIGIWNPATGAHKPTQSARYMVDASGDLVIPIGDVSQSGPILH